MKKQTVIIIIILSALVLATAVLLFLNRGTVAAGRLAQEEKSLTFTEDGEMLAVLYWDDFGALESVTFNAVIRSGGKRPQNVVYKGVEIHDLLDAAGVDWAGKTLYFKGADAYLASVAPKELEVYDSIYIVYAIDGEMMARRVEGGDGPYQLVIATDSFSQRWCKYLAEIELMDE